MLNTRRSPAMPLLQLALCLHSASIAAACSTLQGYTYAHEVAALPNGQWPDIRSPAACCTACLGVAVCASWTFHPHPNGCWLHGNYTHDHPVPIVCGDKEACTSGSGSQPLPPFVPPAPGPGPSPGPSPGPAPGPRPVSLATPSEAHLMFHEDNVGAISHFGMQTFKTRGARSCNTPAAWSDPALFNPVNLDTDQWVRTAKSFGAKYYVLVADHFSGFSLYNTSVHKYSVAHTPWRNGQADIIRDFAASCAKYDIRPGIYYSVHANWHEGVCSFNLTDPAKQAAFEDMAMVQLAELSRYFGESLAEIWFDAGVKQSDAFVKRVADFVATKLPSTATCHSCQNFGNPNVHLVSWMGNEDTVMPYPVWNANDESCSHHGGSGSTGYGIAAGTRWCPAHCDAVLRRHFWFWDSQQYNGTGADNINTAPLLLGMHLTSVGRGCNMILDMSPTDTGLIQQNDVQTYAAMGNGTHTLYNKSFVASAHGLTRGQAVATIAAPAPIRRGALELRENLTLGQAVSSYEVTYQGADGGVWQPLPLHNGALLTIGNRRIQYWDGPVVSKLRVAVTTLVLESGVGTTPHLRSVKMFDWNAPGLDRLLAGILKVQ